MWCDCPPVRAAASVVEALAASGTARDTGACVCGSANEPAKLTHGRICELADISLTTAEALSDSGAIARVGSCDIILPPFGDEDGFAGSRRTPVLAGKAGCK